MGVARAASQGQVGARPRGRRGHVNREEGGSGVRFASDSLQVTAKPAGAGAKRPRSGGLHHREQISINLALSLRGKPCAATLSLTRSKMVQGCDWVKRCPGGSRGPSCSAHQADRWIPAFAGKALGRRFHPGWDYVAPGPIANQPGTASATASSWLLFFSEESQEASVSAAWASRAGCNFLGDISENSEEIRTCPAPRCRRPGRGRPARACRSGRDERPDRRLSCAHEADHPVLAVITRDHRIAVSWR